MAVLRFFCGVVRVLWWLAAACIPYAQHRFYESYRLAIGCPAQGDCYTRGAEHLLELQLLFVGSALVLWPLCAWYLLAKPLFDRRSLFIGRRHATQGAASLEQ